MSYPDIEDLSTAFVLCMCGPHACSRQCTVCVSPAWKDGPCINQLWVEHTMSDAGKAAAQRFNELTEQQKAAHERVNHFMAGYLGEDMPSRDPVDYGMGQPLSDAELVERAIDMMEQGGMTLQPWQATAFRTIMLARNGIKRAPRS